MKKNTSYSIKSIFGIEPIRGCVYIVRKNKEVVYIGLAEKQSVQSRLCKHLESFFSSNKASKFSTLLQKNNPKNFLWRVDILTIEQAGEITRTAYDCLKCAEQGVYDFFIRKQLVIAGNKTRPQSCNKKYMVKGCWRIMKGGGSGIFGKFCLSEKIDPKYGVNSQGYDCAKTSQYKCYLCSKQMNLGGRAWYTASCDGAKIYCSDACAYEGN